VTPDTAFLVGPVSKPITGYAAGAVRLALRSAALADEIGAPIEAALSRTPAGPALTETGDAARAVAELERAANALDACGATRYRDAAEYELRKLGRHIHRRRRPRQDRRHRDRVVDGTTAAGGTTGRRPHDERGDRRGVVPQPQDCRVAPAQHLPQADVSTRVALARAVERADRG
jgi:hypothetical protein